MKGIFNIFPHGLGIRGQYAFIYLLNLLMEKQGDLLNFINSVAVDNRWDAVEIKNAVESYCNQF